MAVSMTRTANYLERFSRKTLRGCTETPGSITRFTGEEKVKMAEIENQHRHRVNVTISTKGVLTWDCTVEAQNAQMDEVLKESDKLVAELKSRYPIKVE